MTVGDLIAELQKIEPNTLVVQSTNAEGSGFSPTYTLNTGLYTPYSTWHGEFHDAETADGAEPYIPEPGDHHAVCIWPTS